MNVLKTICLYPAWIEDIHVVVTKLIHVLLLRARLVRTECPDEFLLDPVPLKELDNTYV